VPAYYTDPALTHVYKAGQGEPNVNWSTGYRLPTEAEWEKAARGGVSGHRFPWGDRLSWSQANYHALPGGSEAGHTMGYDVSPTAGYDPTFAIGGDPYTSPVGYFAANGYGLYDMSRNVWQWCWDWFAFDYYRNSSQSDPRGPTTGSYRVFRGGSWYDRAIYCRASYRDYDSPTFSYGSIGLRSVLRSDQP
jgi:formylglycine-generating enzyme